MKGRRILEFMVGLLIVLFLLGRYSHGGVSRPLVDFVMPYPPFKGFIIIALTLINFRLIGGKSKDYSGFFFNLPAGLFGKPTQRNRK